MLDRWVGPWHGGLASGVFWGLDLACSVWEMYIESIGWDARKFSVWKSGFWDFENGDRLYASLTCIGRIFEFFYVTLRGVNLNLSPQLILEGIQVWGVDLV